MPPQSPPETVNLQLTLWILLRYCQVCKPLRCSLCPSSLIRRAAPVPLAGQLSLFDGVKAVNRIDSDQMSASSATGINSSSATHAIPLRSGDSKSQTVRQQGGKRKRPGVASVPMDARLLVSRKAAAELLTISIRKVDYMIADGRMLTRRIDNRVLIPIEEIRKFAVSDHAKRRAG